MNKHFIAAGVVGLCVVLFAWYFRVAQTSRELPASSTSTFSQAQIKETSQRSSSSGFESSENTATEPSVGVVTPTILAQLELVTPETPSNQAYDVFLGLKRWLSSGPQAIDQVMQILLEPNQGTAAQKRQRTLLYGALAETNDPAASEALTVLVERAQHEDDAIQSAAALGDHQSPPERALDVLWDKSRTRESVSNNAALLAYGSVAHHLGTAGDHAADRLLAEARLTEEAVRRAELLAAMGNHGSPAYFSYIQEAAKDPSESVRAAAVYAARFLPSEAAGTFIAQTAVKDSSDKVKSEAIGALTRQLDVRRDYERLTSVALSSPNEEIQLEAVRVLQAALARDNTPAVRAALAAMLAGTGSQRVQLLLQDPQSIPPTQP